MIKNVSKDLFLRDYNDGTFDKSKSLCISIVNSEDTLEDRFSLSEEWLSRLRVTFDDIDVQVGDYTLFSSAIASLIIRVTLDSDLNVKSEYEAIIVHCTAGVSRSAAIALFLNQLQRGFVITDLNRFGWSCYNRHVFRLLIEAYNSAANTLNLPSYMERLR